MTGLSDTMLMQQGLTSTLTSCRGHFTVKQASSGDQSNVRDTGHANNIHDQHFNKRDEAMPAPPDSQGGAVRGAYVRVYILYSCNKPSGPDSSCVVTPDDASSPPLCQLYAVLRHEWISQLPAQLLIVASLCLKIINLINVTNTVRISKQFRARVEDVVGLFKKAQTWSQNILTCSHQPTSC